MKRAGFIVGSANGEIHIRVHAIEDVDYVTFYKDDRLIPIPYNCLVCFVAGNVADPKEVSPTLTSLEKLIIDTQNF